MVDYKSVAKIIEAGTSNMTVIVSNTKYDDNVFEITDIDWFKFNGEPVSTIFVSSNSYIGFGANSAHLCINNRDGNMYYLYKEVGTYLGCLRFLKIRFSGYSRYNYNSSSYAIAYDVILWETGDIQVHMVSVPSSYNTGTYQLVAVNTHAYSVSSSSKEVTFYYDKDTNDYSVVYEVSKPNPNKYEKYLIRSEGTLYTVNNEALQALGTELSPDLFISSGCDEMPTSDVLFKLTDPELLFWQDHETFKLPSFEANITGLPPAPQMLITEAYDISHETILGISNVVAIASEDVLFAVTFDDEATWKKYDGAQWLDVVSETDGMTAATINAITSAAWAEIATSTAYKFRFILPNETSYITSVVVDYLN